MPEEDVQALLRKALTDDTFRLRLGRNFDKTIANNDLDLSPRETEALKQINWSRAFQPGDLAANSWVHIYN
jgi:hypothetical protein